MTERIGDLQHQEIEKIIRAALRLGESVAQQRAANLARAARMSHEGVESLRRTLGVERDAAQRLYRRALDPRFWDDPSTRVDDVREVVQAARAFAPWDPEAALAARECDKHAGISDAQGESHHQRIDVSERVDEAEATAPADNVQVPRADTHSAEATRSVVTWDSAQARAEWITQKAHASAGQDVHALHGALLADTSLHAPARKVLVSQAKKGRKGSAVSSYRANKMRQKRSHTL